MRRSGWGPNEKREGPGWAPMKNERVGWGPVGKSGTEHLIFGEPAATTFVSAQSEAVPPPAPLRGHFFVPCRGRSDKASSKPADVPTRGPAFWPSLRPALRR